MTLLTNAYQDPLANLLGEWSIGLSFYSILFRLLLAVLIGAIIGCERSNKRHSAGLRTFILVTLLGAVAALIDSSLVLAKTTSLYLFSGAAILGTVVISGNSILFNAKKKIRGLTTSVGLWLCLLLGITLGLGYYLFSLLLTLLLVLILLAFPWIESFLKDKSNHFEIHLELKDKSKLQDFIFTLRQLDIHIDDLEINSAYVGSGLSVYSVSLTCPKKKKLSHKEIVAALSSLEYVSYVDEIM